MRGELHHAPSDARALRQRGGQLPINLETQHIAGGGLQQFAGFVQRHDAPGFEHGNAATQGFRFFEVMGSEQDGMALLIQFGDKCP